MRPVLVLGCAALLAACGDAGADADAGAATRDIAWTQDYEGCGLELQDRLVWGQAVSGSDLDMQQAKFDETDLVLRVWSERDAGLTEEGGALSGQAEGPAWIAADVNSNRGYMAYLDEGTVDLRVEADRFSCASAGETDAGQ